MALKRNGSETTVEGDEGNWKPTGASWVQKECEKGEEQFGNEKKIGRTKSERIIEKEKVQRNRIGKDKKKHRKERENGLRRIRFKRRKKVM